MDPIHSLFEDLEPGDPALGPVLTRLYGGPLRVTEGSTYANFVASLDGVTALGVSGLSSGSAISGRNEADRFLMGLLRARADAVVIGAGTLRDDADHVWTAGHVYPPAASEFAAMRARLGLAELPVLVVMSASGEIDGRARGLVQAPAIVVTGNQGAARLRPRLDRRCELIELPGELPDPATALAELRSRGLRTLLTEGGPAVMGALLAADALDELFLTLSPVLAGRAAAPRPGLVSGLELLPGAGQWSRLASVRRHGDHLFLRYRLLRPAPAAAARTS